jgi:hypothetical protein
MRLAQLFRYIHPYCRAMCEFAIFQVSHLSVNSAATMNTLFIGKSSSRQLSFKGAALVVLVLSLLHVNMAWSQQTVFYPRPESLNDVRGSYPVALLRYCEQQSAPLFTLSPSKVPSQQGRSLRQLVAGNGMSVVWALTNQEREASLLPVRIPIDRGLIGWRLLLINSADSVDFEKITNKQQLAKLVAGQGHDWPDVEVLHANHFNVSTSSTYQGLFHMLARGHIDYFPRAVSEIWPELEANAGLKLAVENKLAIYYPSALYFFVNKNNLWLANVLESCLSTATKDGSLKAIFDDYYLDFILRSKLTHRTILTLTNPSFPSTAPASDSGYWFSPEEYN